MHHQLQETPQLANDETSLQYQACLKEGQQKDLRDLFRPLKSNELA